MRLSMTYCSDLAVYRLRNEDNGREKAVTQDEIDTSDGFFREMAAKCRENPGVAVETTIGFSIGGEA